MEKRIQDPIHSYVAFAAVHYARTRFMLHLQELKNIPGYSFNDVVVYGVRDTIICYRPMTDNQVKHHAEQDTLCIDLILSVHQKPTGTLYV